MPDRDDEERRIIHIGPDADPAVWGDDDDDGPSFLISDARQRVQQRERAEKEATQLARRLILAFLAVMALAFVFHVLMPAFSLALPPLVPILCYVAIFAGAVMTARDQNR
ncbi:MAG: hypothetical protein LAT64_01370 [Phycisphaerales bacterium]|nr:hypothetical protein [Planctomycetota bacterium]MCH8507411.1 hypothetical protein [Phycisphaerales bacterium]